MKLHELTPAAGSNQDAKRKGRGAGSGNGKTAAVVWPLATCVYLLWSFISGSWEISWVVWPVVGVLFGGFCSIYKVVAPKKETH